MTNLIRIKNNQDTGYVEIVGNTNIKSSKIRTNFYNEDRDNIGLAFPIDQNDFLSQVKEGDKVIYFYHRFPTGEQSDTYIREKREFEIDEYTVNQCWDSETKILSYLFAPFLADFGHPEKFDPSHEDIRLTEEDKWIIVVRQPRTVKFTKVEKIVKENDEEEKIYQLYNNPEEPINKFEDKLNLQGDSSISYKISGISIENENIEDTVEEPFIPDFEHAFLADANKNFCIKYNPKIQSFKTVIAEQKVDTIGGRFPLFVRNGNLNYKEIPISGLIAATESDELEVRGETPARTAVTWNAGQQFAKERKEKLELEEWLRNGQPKIFRSAAEGNYIIRLMNISLQPIDTLGRMLHSFSATGYEVAEYSLDKAIEMGLYDAYVELEDEEEIPEVPTEPNNGEEPTPAVKEE